MRHLFLFFVAACATPSSKPVVTATASTKPVGTASKQVSGCDMWWPLDAGWPLSLRSGQGVCARGDTFVITGPTDLVKPIPRTQVYDATGDELVVAGSCGDDTRFYEDDADNARYTDNAICVLYGGHSPGAPSGGSVIYISSNTLSKPGYPRGVVSFSDGVIATNGLWIGIGESDNKTGNHDPDVQAQLVAANIRPADASCVWTVREALHRSGERYEMTFDDCAGAPVNVSVELDDLGDFLWRRI